MDWCHVCGEQTKSVKFQNRGGARFEHVVSKVWFLQSGYEKVAVFRFCIASFFANSTMLVILISGQSTCASPDLYHFVYFAEMCTFFCFRGKLHWWYRCGAPYWEECWYKYYRVRVLTVAFVDYVTCPVWVEINNGSICRDIPFEICADTNCTLKSSIG